MAQLFESEFKKNVIVTVVDSLDYQYQVLAPLFNEYGYGFVAPDKKLVFIDGNHNKDTQKCVEAHEVAHIVLGHGKHTGPTHEAEADSLAIVWLRQYGYHDAANLLVREFKKRHGFSFYHLKNKQNKQKVYSYANI